MRSKTTHKFRVLLADLPADVQKRADDAYAEFCRNPNHPGLRFKKVHANLPVYSVRVTKDYRVVGVINDDTIVWFWIGKHSEYEKLLASL
jgi:mRNA-degrading endonuclease RelE of RelBE toxin-antitoxin system